MSGLNYSQTYCEISKKLRTQRLKAGMTQDELAAKANLDRKTIQRFEHVSGIPTVETFLQLALALGITPNDLTPESYLNIESNQALQTLLRRFQNLNKENQDIFVASANAMIDGFLYQQRIPSS